MTTLADAEALEFKAEPKELLALVIHSLYTQKDIFLRELISNASDALDRFHFETLTNRDAPLSSGYSPAITLTADAAARTLTLSDNGIGMSREETIANLGTIARSGTRELLDRIRSSNPAAVPELIGHFGVGFYSAFMVADHVRVVTRRAGEAAATRWESAGDGQFTVGDTDRDEHGTTIVLTLKPVDADTGVEDYADQWVLSRIVKRYSDFVVYPIVLKGAEVEDPVPFGAEGEQKPRRTEDRTLNSRKPVWAKAAAEVTAEEYREYYRHTTHDWNPPLLHLLAKAEGRVECQALVFIPAEAPTDLFYHAVPYGLQLYSKRVLVIDQCPDLLPRYLRFVKGAVDALDLPLHISRQMLQERWQIERIQKWLTRKILDLLADTRQRDSGTYLTFWKQFGRVLKEGLGTDYDNRERLLSAFLFESSNHPTELTTLDRYVERMKPDQSHIFYLTGESRQALERSPHVEAVLQRGFEVLYLTDPVDDLLVQSLPEHAGKRLKALDRGRLDFGAADAAPDQDTAEFAELTRRLQERLSAHVKAVRLSTRLAASPACLTGEEYDYSPRMERLLLKGKGGGPRQRRILELNPRHPLVVRLNGRVKAEAGGTPFACDEWADLLLGVALVAEGSELLDPVPFGQAIVHLMERAL